MFGGGYLILFTPANNYNGHGFYQFSADLFFGILNGNGFCIQDISYVEEYGNEKYVSYKVERPVPNSKLISKRRVCLQICARRIGNIPLRIKAQQSLYQNLWNHTSDCFTKSKYLSFYDLDREIDNSLGHHNGKKYNKVYGKKFLLYGAGKVCRSIIEENLFEDNRVEIIGIADKNADGIEINGFTVEKIGYYKEFDFEYIVITTEENAAKEIKEELAGIYGYNLEKIMDLNIFLYYLRSCLY